MTQTNQVQKQPEKQPVSMLHNTLTKISESIDQKTITIPANYAWENAVRAAWLHIVEEELNQKCTPDSIVNAIQKMIILGLNPTKNQCSFINYGGKLSCGIEYAGKIMIAKRDAGVKDVSAFAVFDGDTFEFEVDLEKKSMFVKSHKMTLESMNSNKVKGAYAIVTYEDGTEHTEIMSFAQIQASWMMGASKGQSPAHKNFPDQMSIKTVINRALKIDTNSSDDAALMEKADKKILEAKETVQEKSNVEDFVIEPVIDITDDKTAPEQTAAPVTNSQKAPF